MREPSPSVLRRLLELRHFEMLANVDLDELATIGENLVETTLPAGTVIATAGTRQRHLSLVLEGAIESVPARHRWGPRQAHGALEVLARRDALHTAVAATDVRLLQVTAAEVGDLLEDNFGLLVASLRQIAGRLTTHGPRLPHGALGVGAGRLGLVERLIVLRQQRPFATTRLPALAALAHASEEVSWAAGAVIARPRELAHAGYVILEGEVRATSGGQTQALGPGGSVGFLEMIGGLHHDATIAATTPVRALCTTQSALLDVIEDHTDVGISMLAALASELLEGPR